MRDAPTEASRLRLADGRHLGWQAYGLPGGAPVFFFHGSPGSRLQAALVHEPAAAAGMALIAFDRPGFGASDPDPQCRSVDDLVGDVQALADHLGHPRFGVIGVSCGGPYALACARALPQRVSAVGLLAGVGPMDRPEARQGQLPLLRALFALARVHARLAAPLLVLDAWLFRADAQRAVQMLSSMLSAPDRALLASDPSVRRRFGASLADAYRQGLAGALMEAARIARHRSDALAGIEQPVQVFQSGHDRHVPPAMGRWLAGALPNALLHECAHEGHLSIVVNRFGDCARRVAAGMLQR